MNPDFKSYLKECQTLVRAALEEFLPAKNVFPQKIHEAMRYSLMAEGKRVRPVLCLAAAEACGQKKETVIPVACALEMIHTFSLIHDDLPAMDDDNFRRGVPTNHRVFGEAIAILAGDALISQAFIVLGRMCAGHADPARMLEVIQDIAEATGSLGMVGGQVVDLESEGKKPDLETLRRLHHLKTGRLIAVSVTSSAKLSTRDEKKIQALLLYGQAIGLAFQIADDILDIEGGEDLGKDIGSDFENQKATFPALMGLKQAKKEARALCDEALDSLKNFGPEADILRTLAVYIVERKK